MVPDLGWISEDGNEKDEKGHDISQAIGPEGKT